MNKPLGLALLVGGIILIVFGVNESNSFGSDVNRFFTGNPTDKSMWFLILGAAAAIAGLTMTVRRSKR